MIFCGLLMFIGVSCYKYCIKTNDSIFAMIMPILCVAVFILAGFEHCVADMFYFALSGRLTDGIFLLLIITAGNTIGGLLIPVVNLVKEPKHGK